MSHNGASCKDLELVTKDCNSDSPDHDFQTISGLVGPPGAAALHLDLLPLSHLLGHAWTCRTKLVVQLMPLEQTERQWPPDLLVPVKSSS